MDKEPVLKVCAFCSSCSERMSKCSVCKDKRNAKVYYCSKTCQEQDWPEHKKLHRENAPIAPADGVDENGMTELMNQLWIGDKNKVKLMMKKGSDVVAVDFQGFSTLDYAISRGHLDVAKELLEEHPELLSTRSVGRIKRPCYSLILACQGGNIELVKLILTYEAGKALINASENRHLPIYFACQLGHHEIVKLLLDAGGPAQALEKTPCGSFPLGIACQKGHRASACRRPWSPSCWRRPATGPGSWRSGPRAWARTRSSWQARSVSEAGQVSEASQVRQ